MNYHLCRVTGYSDRTSGVGPWMERRRAEMSGLPTTRSQHVRRTARLGADTVRVTLHNQQSPADPLSGSHLDNADRLGSVLDGLQSREPFLLEIEGENGFRLTMGIGGPVGCAQYASSDGEPPYLMAVMKPLQPPVPTGEYVFLCGGQETPISADHCVPYAVLRAVAIYFMETGRRSPDVNWVEV